MYAIKATILDNHPLSLYLLKEIKVIAMINNIIPANDTHIFIIGLIDLSPNIIRCIRQLNVL